MQIMVRDKVFYGRFLRETHILEVPSHTVYICLAVADKRGSFCAPTYRWVLVQNLWVKV